MCFLPLRIFPHNFFFSIKIPSITNKGHTSGIILKWDCSESPEEVTASVSLTKYLRCELVNGDSLWKLLEIRAYVVCHRFLWLLQMKCGTKIRKSWIIPLQRNHPFNTARLKEKRRISVILRKKLASMRIYSNFCRTVESVGNSCSLFWQQKCSSHSLSFNPGVLYLTSLLWVKTSWQTTLGKQAFHCPI